MSVNFSELLLYKQLRRRGLVPEEIKQKLIESKKAALVEKANQVGQRLLAENEKLQPPAGTMKMDFLAPDQKLVAALSGTLTTLHEEQKQLQDAVEGNQEQLAVLSMKKEEAMQKMEQLKQLLKNPPMNQNIKNIYLAASRKEKKV